MENTGKLKGYTVFITGASRGIGKAVALKVAKDGANVVIASKTAEPNPRLRGTIYTAAKEIEDAGGKALPCVVDVRSEEQIQAAIDKAVARFGGIDILVNNASAISVTDTPSTTMKKFDLMHQVNTRGTFLCTKLCLPHLIQSKKNGRNPHVLNMAPPLPLDEGMLAKGAAYAIAKYGMSLCTLGMSQEFREFGIAVNSLWPRTVIWTAAVENLGGSYFKPFSRVPDVVADASYAILIRNPSICSGNYFYDDNVLNEEGIHDLHRYDVDKTTDGSPMSLQAFFGAGQGPSTTNSKL